MARVRRAPALRELAEGPAAVGDPLAVRARVPRDRDPSAHLQTAHARSTRAVAQVDAWLESPRAVLLAESGTHWPTLRATLEAGRISGPHVHDARIAALCIDHGIDELWTADRDFSRFPGARVRNPLIPTGA